MQKYSSDRALSANLKRLNLMLEYAARDIAIKRHEAGKGNEAERQKMVSELITFVRKNANVGVFVFHDRFEESQLSQRYGIPTD